MKKEDKTNGLIVAILIIFLIALFNIHFETYKVEKEELYSLDFYGHSYRWLSRSISLKCYGADFEYIDTAGEYKYQILINNIGDTTDNYCIATKTSTKFRLTWF